MKIFYLVWGAVVLGLFGGSSYFGWSLSSADEEKKKPVPRNMRDNPGAYRRHYYFVGGK